MRRKNRTTTPVVESNDRGISAAGEVAGAAIIFALVVGGGLLWGTYTLITFLYSRAVSLFSETLIMALIVAVPITLGGVVLYAVVGRITIWLEYRQAESRQAQLQARYVQPNEDGLLPVDRRFIESDRGAEMALQLALAQQRSKWIVGDVPTSLTYSPRYNNRQDVQQLAGQDVPQLALPTPQSFWQLYSGNQLPKDGFLMGYSLETGEVVNADWSKLYSALIGGQSGSGKSTLIRSILAQSALQGGRFLVLDPHYGAGEESLGASLQPLRHLMLTDVASTDAQMGDALAYVREIGHRRLAGRDRDRTPVILVVDETTALLQRSSAADALADALGEISQETRKVGVYAMAIGQNFDGRIMDTTIRNTFVSFISCRARRDVARVMTSDAEFGKRAQQLQTGQAVWMTPGGEMWSLAVPNCTAHDLELVAQHTQNGVKTYAEVNHFQTTSHTGKQPLPQHFPVASLSLPEFVLEATGKQVGSGLEADTEMLFDATAQRILNMHADGNSIHKIVETVYGTKGGRKYQDMRSVVESVIEKWSNK